MSLLLSTEDGWIISHSNYLKKIYKKVDASKIFYSLEFDETFFHINCQFIRDNQFSKSLKGISSEEKKLKKRKLSDELSQEELERVNYLKEAVCRILSCIAAKRLFTNSDFSDNNKAARAVADKFYSESFLRKLNNFHGSNEEDIPIVAEIGGERFVFPEKCSFYAYDVRNIAEKLDTVEPFDFILMDPPWWNKFVRRKKRKFLESSYDMMYNEDFAKIPINNLLNSDGIIAVWCTNAPSHLRSITNEMFSSWGVTLVARWYWVKVTESGQTICDFNTSKRKQPYETLIFGQKSIDANKKLPDKKVMVSVPSCVHSHKPPIVEILRPYLKENARCLEIFARYLLPNWTSWGLEVLKFQHLSLYKMIKESDGDCTINDEEL